ncbi:hypothetical protein BKA62DRAFT_78818 [Auriculariales sp. MPI-PUGE-AT-0066]|nr:hypothetical protein BKA62DRAFT_78818 [Auriculariales sp. MPI-PUGE-AT-0066]
MGFMPQAEISPPPVPMVLQQPSTNDITAQDQVIHNLHSRIYELEQQIAHIGVSPAILHAHPRPNDIQLRADARTKHFLRNNRNGNRMCRWCDSRREKRKFRPYKAPRDTMSCGCSVEQVKFEETLANNGVGSLKPGESVARLSPALRAALLKLLKSRYGYIDGDFDFHLHGGHWASGDGVADWEARASRDE